MNPLTTRMNLIRDLIAERLTDRIVTRSFKDFDFRQPEELKCGVITIVSAGESDFANLRERAAMDGRHRMNLIGQLQVLEESDPVTVEDAEFELVEELKAFLRDLPLPIACLEMKNWRQSGQLEHPFGWIACELELES